MKYSPPRSIAVDVDGTLIEFGQLNQSVVDWCVKKRGEGFSLTLWSARGEMHARTAAALHGVDFLFDHIISKPGYILDDKGWTWIRFCPVVRSLAD